MKNEELFKPRRIKERLEVVKTKHKNILQGRDVMEYFETELYSKTAEFVREALVDLLTDDELIGLENYQDYCEPHVLAIANFLFLAKFKYNMKEYKKLHKARIVKTYKHTYKECVDNYRLSLSWPTIIYQMRKVGIVLYLKRDENAIKCRRTDVVEIQVLGPGQPVTEEKEAAVRAAIAVAEEKRNN